MWMGKVLIAIAAGIGMVSGLVGSEAASAQGIERYSYPQGWSVPQSFLKSASDVATVSYQYGGEAKTWQVPVRYQEKAVNLRFETFPLEGAQYPVWEKVMSYAASEWPELDDRSLQGFFTVRRHKHVKEEPQEPIEKVTYEHREYLAKVTEIEVPPEKPKPPAVERQWERGSATGHSTGATEQ